MAQTLQPLLTFPYRLLIPMAQCLWQRRPHRYKWARCLCQRRPHRYKCHPSCSPCNVTLTPCGDFRSGEDLGNCVSRENVVDSCCPASKAGSYGQCGASPSTHLWGASSQHVGSLASPKPPCWEDHVGRPPGQTERRPRSPHCSSPAV